ncbi:MAG: hypothetical protein JWM87_1171 [Candidatus Eremiobacteraeota bacterium]|nr:hypothetical protein [Candidatus Eremiobacteraeota bacterium]
MMRTMSLALSFAMLVSAVPAGAIDLRPVASAVTHISFHGSAHVTVAQSGGLHPRTRIPVADPPRHKRPSFVPSAIRPPSVHLSRSGGPGVRVPGPAMLRPSEIDHVLRAARAQARSRALQPALPKPIVLSPTTPVTVTRTRPGAPVAPKATVRTTASLSGFSSGTGINPWWRYQEQNIPGGGRLMANVGTGNVLLQDDDMAVPNKGISLAFRRTYNSQSLHDVNASDAAPWYWKPAGLYGNGWTNTFDAHLVRTPDSSQLSVFDIDGTRYDFVPGGGWYSPVPGNDTTLTYDNACGVLWTKKSGTTYYFYRPNPNAPCPGFPNNGGLAGGFAGRLYQIIGRNRNTYITFSYAWDGGIASATGKISSITAQTEAGRSATLYFGDVNGHRLLQQLVYPDGVTSLWYGYDALGNLTWVSRPENNASGVRPIQTFGYQSIGTGSVLQYAASPRYDAGCRAAGCGTDGGLLTFTFTGSSVDTSALSSIWHYAVVNPIVSDGTNSGALQGASYSTAAFWYLGESYTTGVTTPTYRDTDGHMTNWVVDNTGRPMQTQECTASVNQGQQCTGQWLLLNESWDGNNNLVSETDARGYETDYAYDSVGNTVAVAEPAVDVQSAAGQVTTRPTKLFSYDVVNGFTTDNVVSYCDEVWTQAHGRSWDQTGNPGSSDTLCPAVAGGASAPTVPTFTYEYPPYQPYGRLSQSVTASGYHKTYRYDLGPQQGNDFGLPTEVTGDGFTEVDGTTYVQAHQTFAYDTQGNLISYGPGVGTWSLAYDSLSRLTSATDPDGLASRKYYFPDGTLKKLETPAQHAANVGGQFTFDAGVLYAYDLDGNMSGETHHHGNQTGVIVKAYDGADRLVEVEQPENDPSGAQQWFTRYLYDLQAGSNVTVSGTSFRAYGGLFDTQENLGSTSGPWRDIRAQEFDGLDRMIGKYAFAPNSNTTLRKTTFTYDDASTTLGLLASAVDPLGQTTTYAYDAAARKRSITFGNDAGATPNRTYAYDAGGRSAKITSSVFGTQVTTYDADGRLRTVAEGSGGGFTSSAVIGYDYYPDGRRKNLTVQSAALTASPLMTYVYRADGLRSGTALQVQGFNFPFSWTYTNAGRATAQSDPFTGTTVPNPQPNVPAGTLYAPKRWTYDGNGDLATLKLPVIGTYNQIAHDLEGAVTSYHVQPYGKPDNTLRIKPNVAGEVASQTVQVQGQAEQVLSTTRYVNGTRKADFGFQHGPHTASATYDFVNGVQMSTNTWTVNDSGLQCNVPNTTAEIYDVASRHTVTNVVTLDTYCTSQNGSLTTSYNAENHAYLLSSNGLDAPARTWSGAVLAAGLGWGPNGHPSVRSISANSTTLVNPTTHSLHYDGDMLLFGTDSSGQLEWVSPELLGRYMPANTYMTSTFTVQDRDFANMGVTAHNQTGYDQLDYLIGAYRSPKSFPVELSEPGNATGIGVSSWSPYVHPDGFDTEFGTIQGTRISDPSTGTWTTPDAYAGNVHDPMSMKPFMWNGNNPYVYSDPSGYTPTEQSALQAELLMRDFGGQAMERAILERELNSIGARTSQALRDRLAQIRARADAGKYPTKPGVRGGPGSSKRFNNADKKAVQCQDCCSACGRSDLPLEADHVQSRSTGGNNTPENRDGLCRICNASKGSDDPWEWLRRLFGQGYNPGPQSGTSPGAAPK